MLSYVEFYRPKFFLLENVIGLVNHKLRVNKAGPHEGNIVAHGVVKFILRTLTSLGYVPSPRFLPIPCSNGGANCAIVISYQVRFSALQAGVYGSPQHRRRVIFWGARRGVPLPEFPIPTHNFESTMWAVQLDTGLKLDHVARDPDRPHRGAPLRAVTVDDVISDLVKFQPFTLSLLPTHRRAFCCCFVSQPKFDWYVAHLFVARAFCVPNDHQRDIRMDPHSVIGATREDRSEVKRRAAKGIPAFEAVSFRRGWDQSEEDPFPGYPDGVPYASPPRTRYQARVRQGIAEDADVELHYTARFTESVLERLVTPAFGIRHRTKAALSSLAAMTTTTECAMLP
jgi:DNA (cytosine-5)-methyltransferase 1